MDLRLLWRALAVQGLAVLALFALLVALPLPGDFFRDWGFLTGPVAWTACALLTGRVLALGNRVALVAALVGGAAGIAALVTLGHSPSLVAALVGFATWIGAVGRGETSARRPPRRRAGTDSRRGDRRQATTQRGTR